MTRKGNVDIRSHDLYPRDPWGKGLAQIGDMCVFPFLQHVTHLFPWLDIPNQDHSHPLSFPFSLRITITTAQPALGGTTKRKHDDGIRHAGMIDQRDQRGYGDADGR